MWDILASFLGGIICIVAACVAVMDEIGWPWLQPNPAIFGGGWSAGGVGISFLFAGIGIGLLWRAASLWRTRNGK